VEKSVSLWQNKTKMKRLFIILASLLALQVQAQNNDWENPAVLGINKLP
jgi:hypothetical protein